MIKRCATLKTLIGLGVAATITLAVVLGVAVPMSASAAEYKCENHFLDETDEMQLRRTALKALPKSSHLDEVWPCRNSDSAHAFILTRKTIAKDGANHWWQFTCRRDAWYWRCDPPESKNSYQTHLFVEGSLHDVDLAFDGEISLDRALKLVDITLKAYQPSEGLLFCGDKVSHEPDKKDLWSHSPMPEGKVSIEVTLDKEDASQTVLLQDPSVAMSFPVQQEPVASCWNIEIFVD